MMITLQWMGWVAALLTLGMLARMIWLRRNTYSTPSHHVDTLVGAPSTSRPLNASERLTYKLLTEAMPADYFLLAQVALARFIKVSQRTSYRAWYDRIGHRCVDFVVCNADGEVVAVIELDEHRPSSVGYGKVVQRKAKVLAASGVPVLHWTSETPPDLEDARDQLEKAEFGAVTRARHANAVPSGMAPLAPREATLPAPLDSEAQEFNRRWAAAEPILQASREHIGDTVTMPDVNLTEEEKAAIARRFQAADAANADDPWHNEVAATEPPPQVDLPLNIASHPRFRSSRI